MTTYYRTTNVMDIKVIQGAIQKQDADVLVVNLFAGARPGGATGAVDQALGGQISAAIDLGDFEGKAGQTLLLYTHGQIPAPRVLVVGLGEQEGFDLERARRASLSFVASNSTMCSLASDCGRERERYSSKR